MDRTERALAYLRRDPLLYVNLMEVVRRGSADILWAEEGGVLLHDRGSGSHMFSARTQEAASRIFHLLPPDADLLTGHELWYFDELEGRTGFHGHKILYSCRWTQKQPPSPPNLGGELRLLGPEWAERLNGYYDCWAGVDYIRQAAGRGLYGAFLGGELAGFGGFHDEGAMGMLEVLPDFRRRGVGEALETALIRHALDRGQYAFAQVETDNRASLALQEKLGLERSEGAMFWMFP